MMPVLGKKSKSKKQLPVFFEEAEKALPRSRIGMRGRIFGIMLIFCLVMLIFLWLFQIIYLDVFYEFVKTDQIKSASQDIVEHLGEDDLQDLVVQLAKQRQICITVYNVEYPELFQLGIGEVAGADVLTNCIIHHIGVSSLAQFYEVARAQGNIFSERFTQVGRTAASRHWFERFTSTEERLPDSLIYARIQEASDGNTYFIVLNSNISPLSATVSVLRYELIIVSLLMLVLSLLLSTLIASSLSRPIYRLNRSARRLAAGDFSVKFDARGYREIGELADTLNYASEELARTGKLQQEIVANISHDLRTPLTMIGGYAEFMRDFPDEDHTESINVIIEETERLTRLIRDVLDSSRLESGLETLQRSPFNLTISLRDFVSHYNALMEKDGYHIIFDADVDVLVNADEQRLEQAVGNLLNNALTHCGEDKQIIVRQILRGNIVRVEIVDNGPGIAKNDLPHIWERYYHADAPQRAGKGSGLGLSIVKGILELHGAPYGVISELGKGSTFWFELPMERWEN